MFLGYTIENGISDVKEIIKFKIQLKSQKCL